MFLPTAAAAAALLLQGPYGGGPGPQSGRPDQLPGGSYQRSCQNADVVQGRLYAECSDRSRRLRWSSIPLRRCAGYPIENRDGLLSCSNQQGDFERGPPGRPGPGGPGGLGGPGGPGRGPSITVYEDSEFRGRQATFDRAIPNLSQTGFNDMITSFRVQGRWEVCEDPGYRGRCQTYDYDESNVSTFKLNDRISSMRPVGRY